MVENQEQNLEGSCGSSKTFDPLISIKKKNNVREQCSVLEISKISFAFCNYFSDIAEIAERTGQTTTRNHAGNTVDDSTRSCKIQVELD